MDSVVDAFFPLIDHIDDEVEEIDSLVIDPSSKPTRKVDRSRPALAEANLKATLDHQDGIEMSDRSSSAIDEKHWSQLQRAKEWPKNLAPKIRKRSKASFHSLRCRLRVWRTKLGSSRLLRTPGRILHSVSVFLGLNHFRRNNPNRDAAFRPAFDRSMMLRRMTDIRRLTTGLTRLLGSKYQVITRLKRRAAENGGEVSAYIGDVQGKNWLNI